MKCCVICGVNCWLRLDKLEAPGEGVKEMMFFLPFS